MPCSTRRRLAARCPGLFTVGEAAFGSVTVAGGTPITSNGLATLGNGAAGIGQVSLGGFGSNSTIGGSTSDLILGDEGVGLVTPPSSAILTVPDDTIIGSQTSSSGKLVVAGLGSVFDSGDDLTLGSSGFGVVEITAGGGVDSDAVVIGDSMPGEVTRDDCESAITLDGNTGHDRRRGTGRFRYPGWRQICRDRQHRRKRAQGGVGVVDVVVESAACTLIAVPTLRWVSAGAGELRIRDGGLLMSRVDRDGRCHGDCGGNGNGKRHSARGWTSRAVCRQAAARLSSRFQTVALFRRLAVWVVSSTGSVTLAGGRWESVAAANDAISVSGLLTGSGMFNVQGVTIAGAPHTDGLCAAVIILLSRAR
ncbi:MAG: hypothetical protein U0805_13555 [Pirellulales bacterium]